MKWFRSSHFEDLQKNIPDVPAITKNAAAEKDNICGGLDEHATREKHSQNVTQNAQAVQAAR